MQGMSGNRCWFTHSPVSPASKAKAKAKAKPKPKAGPKAKPAAKRKAAPKAGPRTGYDPEQLAARAKIPCNAISNGRCRFGDRCHYSLSADSANVAMHLPPFEVTDNSDFEITISAHGILYHQGIFLDIAIGSDQKTHATGHLHVEPHTDHLVQEFDMTLIVSEHFLFVIGCLSERSTLPREPHDRLQRDEQRGCSFPSEDGIIPKSGDSERYHHDGPDGRLSFPKFQSHSGSHMTSCPDILSAGKLVMEPCFSFDWQANRKPTLTDKCAQSPQQKYGPMIRFNRNAVRAFPGERDFENTYVLQTPLRVEGSQVSKTRPLALQGDAAPGTLPLPRKERQIGISLKHYHRMNHFPKGNECDICKQAKISMALARCPDPYLRDLKAEKFMDLLWSDHIIVGKHKCSRGIIGERAGLFIDSVESHVQDTRSLICKNTQNTSLRLFTSSDTVSGRGSYLTPQWRSLWLRKN